MQCDEPGMCNERVSQWGHVSSGGLLQLLPGQERAHGRGRVSTHRQKLPPLRQLHLQVHREVQGQTLRDTQCVTYKVLRNTKVVHYGSFLLTPPPT